MKFWGRQTGHECPLVSESGRWLRPQPCSGAGCRHLVRALWWLVWWLPWVEVIVAVAYPSGP